MQNQGSDWGPPQPPQLPPAPPAPPYGSPGFPSKYCHACGSTIDARAEICPRCGVRQPGYAGEAAKSRSVAAALALLLGNFGLHRFYLGNVALGILYLAFFWTAIPGLVAWLEAIYFLTRSNEEWAHAHGGPVQKPNAVGIGCLWILALWPLLAIAAIGSLVVLGTAMESILIEIGSQI